MKTFLLLIIPLFVFCFSYSDSRSVIENRDTATRCAKQSDIKILSQFPREKYVDLGVVSASDLAGDLDDLLNELREKAGGICADAVVVDNTVLANTSYKRNIAGTAIKYEPEQQTQLTN